MNPAEISACPSCHAPLPNAFHRRLNSFWRGVSSADCPNCETTLEYEGGLKAKLRRAGVLTRAGVIGLVVSVALRLFASTTELIFNPMIGLSFLLFIVGLLMSATKPDQIKVVVSGPAD